MPGTSRPACPFVAGPKIDDPRCFVGRREELKFLAARMSGSQPVSVNVTGERRIGKSSLLCQFWRTWEQRVDAPARFAVFYADLQEADPASEDAFFQLLAKTLLTRPALHRDSDINAALSKFPFTRQDFSAALDLLARRSLLPVFCLDEFEMLLKRKEQFGDPFFDHLRGLMNANRLMFIFASREPVDVYAKEQQLTSGFFNLGHLRLLPSLIAEAYHESPTAARSTINYLISSTNQQKTAGKAMLLIAAEEFRRCRTAGDIAAVRGQLDWLPADLTGKINLCLDLSQDTAAALVASSPYRQEERLKQVCGKIDQQRNALAAASAREATTLGAVLDQWQGILTTACRTLHETAQRSGEIPQIYLPGPPLEPDKAGRLFKGRRDLFRQIESLLLSAQPPTLVMHGNRRSGKSSALLQLPEQMPSDILPLFVDCQGAATSVTLEGLAHHLAEQLLASAKATFRLHLPPPDKDELHRDPFAALLAWLDTVEQAAPGKTFLLCLDEFERIDEIVTATGSRAPLNFLRHLIQHRRCWQLLFAGSHTPEELAPHWSDCLINTRSLRVSCLDKADAVELICRPVPDFPEIWPEAAVEEVWQLTHGQPFLIQLLCQEAVEHLNRRKAKTVQPGDVAAVLPAAFEHGHYYFDEFWRALNEDQRTLLAAVAKGEAVPPELHTAAAALLRKEVLVQEENGGYAFKVPLIGEWIAAKL